MLKRFIIILIFISLVTACNFALGYLEPGKIIGDPDTLSHIRMLDGNTGKMIVFAPSADTQAVLAFIHSLEGKWDPEFGVSAGYRYWIAGYRNGEEAFRPTFGSSTVKINGRRYQLNRDVSSELDALFAMAPYGNLLKEAMADLASERKVGVDVVTPISVEAHTFPDTSLGVPEEGMVYAQVQTPGYILTLSVEDEIFTYHGSEDRLIRVPVD
jgi:hypothetical protein